MKNKNTSWEKRVVAIWAGMKFAVGIRRTLIMTMALLYFISIGIPVLWITTLFAVSSLIAVFMEFPTGAVADYDSRKKSLLICFFLFGISYLGIFLVSNFWLISIFWITAEIAWTFNTGAGSAWIVDNLKVAKNKNGIVRLTSKGFLFQKGGFILGGLIGLFIIGINFRLIWLVGSVMYWILFFAMWKFGEERNFKPESIPNHFLMKSLIKAKESYKFIFGKTGRNNRVKMLGDFIGGVGWGIFWIGVPLMFVEVLGLSSEHFSGLNSIFAVVSLSVILILKKINFSKNFGSYLFFIFMISSFIIVLFGFSSGIIYAIIIMALVNISVGIAEIVGDSAGHYIADSKIRASLGSVGSINSYIANSIGVFIAGILFVSIGASGTLIISGAIVFIQSFIYLMMRE
ncbi:MFS transporter [archaeon]|jgi:MFS family permease|nr:MFS transporter [archaeon]MBT7128154.1 MFS transporter [archaeon]MBT7281881.1 MFS transporter [archaeon]